MTIRLQGVPSHVRQRLAQALESGQLDSKPTRTALRFVLGSTEYEDQILAGIQSLGDNGVEGFAAGAWLRTFDQAQASAPAPDLVWSGPEVPGLQARETRRVYEELLGSAERSIWASTYAFFDGPRAFEILARRLDEKPALDVKLLLNIQRKRGDTSSPDSVVRSFADQFWSRDWPGLNRPQVFYDPRSIELSGPLGVLHAKAVVVDVQASFVTSANLTEAALDRNVELGVLVRDRAFALAVVAYLQGLIDNRLLRPLPSR
jgi:phosphatidylserine/phosphatidylglycerophosphate/cardiolipin synthase-like enzyme